MASTTAAASKKRKHDELRSEEDDDDSSSTSSSSDEEEQEEQEEPKALQIVVRRVGKSEKDSLELELPDAANATVLDLKHKISEALQEAGEADIPHDRQRLIYAGKMLRDDTQSLQDDLKMKQQDGKKLFVHLTPLPKGVTPSVRTARELSENPAAAQQQQRVAAASATRRRRRHSSQSSRPGMSDPAAYHPYALDLSSGSLVPAAVAAQQPPPADDAAALLSAAVAAVTEQQTREQQLRDLRNRINLDNIPVDVLARAVVLSFRMDQPTTTAQPLQNSSLTSLLGGAAAAPAQGGNAAAIASEISRLLAPQQQQQPSTMDLLENSLQETPTLASLLRQAQPQQVPTVAAEAIPSLAAATSTDALLASNPAVSSLLQELMARQGTPTVAASSNSGELAQMLDQIAANAGELATAVRQMGVETTSLTTAAARLPSTPVAPVVVSAATTPQNAAAAALIEQLSAAPQPPSAQASLLDRLAASASLSQPAATTANAASLIEQLTAAAQPPPAAPTTASLLEQLTAPAAAASASSLVEQLSAPTASQASLLGQLSTTSPSNIDVAALLGQAQQAQPIAVAAAADATLQRRALEEQLANMLQPGASLGFLPF